MTKCPVCGMMVDEKTAPTSVYKGKKYYFHKPQHKVMFDNDPERYLSQRNLQSSH
jgi:YHS domain-containing protein